MTGAALGKSCLVALEDKRRRGTPGKEISWKAIQSGTMNFPFFSPLCSGCWIWVVTGIPEEINVLLKKKIKSQCISHLEAGWSAGLDWDHLGITIRRLQEVKRTFGNLKESSNMQSRGEKIPLQPVTYRGSLSSLEEMEHSFQSLWKHLSDCRKKHQWSKQQLQYGSFSSRAEL